MEWCNKTVANGNSFSVSLKKKGSMIAPFFFSVNPACSLRFPITSHAVKAIAKVKMNYQSKNKISSLNPNFYKVDRKEWNVATFGLLLMSRRPPFSLTNNICLQPRPENGMDC